MALFFVWIMVERIEDPLTLLPTVYMEEKIMCGRGRGGCFSLAILATPRSVSGNVTMKARTNAKVHQEWKHNLYAGKMW
jgi:hypothetical protein